jgi:hypothetical protein
MSKQVSKGKKNGRVRGLTKVAKVRVGRQSMEDGRAGNTRRTAMAANGGAGMQVRQGREVGMQAVGRQGTRKEERGWRASRQINQEAEAGKKGLAGKTG